MDGAANWYKRMLLGGVVYGGLVFLIAGCAGSPFQTRNVKETMLIFQEAQQLFDQGQFQQAIKVWEQIRPSDPRYLDAQLEIRSARLKIEEIKNQQIATSRVLSQVDILISQAERLEQQGDLPEAVKKYEAARRLDPKNLFLYNTIEELHALLDDTRERHARLGDMYLAQGEYEKSKAEWEQLLQIDPANDKAKQRLADLEVLTATSDTVFVKRGEKLLEKGLLNAAKAEFEKARRVNPTNTRTQNYVAKLENFPFTEYVLKKGETLSAIAQKYTGNRRSNVQILADFNSIAAKTPLKAGQVIKIPHILGFKQALAPKEQDILSEPAPSEAQNQTETRAINQPNAPETPEALKQLLNDGVTAFQEGKYREAVSLLEKVLLQDPENEEAYTYFSRATENVRRGTSVAEISPPQAAEPSEQANPQQSEVQALIQTGISYREAGDLKKAIATFEQASQVDPNDSEVITYLDETRDDLKKLITAHLNEGIKHFNQDALEEAIAEWNKVLELDPANRQAADYKERAATMLKTLSAH